MVTVGETSQQRMRFTRVHDLVMLTWSAMPWDIGFQTKSHRGSES